jgi:putative membrane protein
LPVKKEDQQIIWDAEFNDAVTTYWLLNGTIICVVTIIGLVVLPLWLILGKWATRKYLASHRCSLTTRTLKVSKGILTRVEKTVPLDRITDLGIIQGPIMRYFDIEALSVETAGQSSEGSLVKLAGIKNGRAFRDAVLEQRDKVVGSFDESTSKPILPVGREDSRTSQLLEEISQTLKRIEAKQNLQ